ncbi:wrt-10 [Pristionchus pacificus]|uniref:Wrt-10 n=1 Tax=Pristionchus pacificus TaxID=54126 RepID=A0A2A6CZL1_PRIPA|nr:wrt-10 [Pristionchus pacificus]|eukprot:PDM83497.1 wrt-10 [Pristionchus pacificus]
MKRPLIMRFLLAVSLLVAAALVAAESKPPIRGTKCAPNQVINRLTVYENGAIEAECGPLPCGSSGYKCTDGIVACRSDNDIFNGMSWAPNGQSVLLRCCGLNVPKKIYVGTDLVTAGSFYVGGAISEKDKYGSGGAEYDFITNIRTEQGGVRVWVYRVMCDAPGAHAAAPRPAAAAAPVQQPRPAPAAVPAVPAETDAARQEAFEARRRYLLERLSGQQKQQAAQSEEIEEQGDEEGEYEDEEESPASTFNPLRYRPAVRGNKAPRV